MNDTANRPAGYVWVRVDSEEKAVESAARLVAKYPEYGFTVTNDDLGYDGFNWPWAVTSF